MNKYQNKPQIISKQPISWHCSGFTLFEILLAIGLLFMVAALTTPIIVNLYNRQENQSVSDEIMTTLKKAQAYAFYNKHDENFGIKFDNANKTFIMFKGIYDVNDTDNEIGQLYLNTVSLNPSIPDDIILFTKKTGYTENETEITVTLGNFEKKFYVCENGLIDFAACD